MIIYVCNICGTIYVPEQKNLTLDMKEHAPFEDLPDDWRCPVCSSSKDNLFVDEIPDDEDF